MYVMPMAATTARTFNCLSVIISYASRGFGGSGVCRSILSYKYSFFCHGLGLQLSIHYNTNIYNLAFCEKLAFFIHFNNIKQTLTGIIFGVHIDTGIS